MTASSLMKSKRLSIVGGVFLPQKRRLKYLKNTEQNTSKIPIKKPQKHRIALFIYLINNIL